MFSKLNDVYDLKNAKIQKRSASVTPNDSSSPKMKKTDNYARTAGEVETTNSPSLEKDNGDFDKLLTAINAKKDEGNHVTLPELKGYFRDFTKQLEVQAGKSNRYKITADNANDKFLYMIYRELGYNNKYASSQFTHKSKLEDKILGNWYFLHKSNDLCKKYIDKCIVGTNMQQGRLKRCNITAAQNYGLPTNHSDNQAYQGNNLNSPVDTSPFLSGVDPGLKEGCSHSNLPSTSIDELFPSIDERLLLPVSNAPSTSIDETAIAV